MIVVVAVVVIMMMMMMMMIFEKLIKDHVLKLKIYFKHTDTYLEEFRIEGKCSVKVLYAFRLLQLHPC